MRIGVKFWGWAIAFVLLIAPSLPAEAVPCRQIHGESVCIAEIKRSAKNHWEYRVSVQSGSRRSPLEIYNCRDRVAFVRVCTGKFEKDMSVNHARTGKTVRLSRPQKLFAQDRASIEVAYPGDVIGLNNPGMFAIGDTIYNGKKLEYEGIPCFSPELFAYLKNPNPSKFKQFQKGIQELQEEGAIQIMYAADEFKRDPILAAVGQLQFEVVQFRLLNEYGVETTLEPLGYSLARWVVGGWSALEKTGRIFNTMTVKDSWERPVLLFKNTWNLQQIQGDHPDLKLASTAPVGSGLQPT
jgi:peptide chain release factor 3